MLWRSGFQAADLRLADTCVRAVLPTHVIHTAAIAALAAVVAAAAAALPAALGDAPAGGAGGGSDVLPPMDQLARYLERVIPPSSSASQWLADNAAFLPQDYRDRLLDEHPYLPGGGGPAGQQDGPAGASSDSPFRLPDPFDIFLGETFAYGRLRAAAPDGAVADQAGVTVCLVDRVSGGAFAALSNPETGEAACAETDSAGRFAGHIFTDGDHGNPVDLWLNISAAGGAGAVVDGNGSTYAVLVDASDDLDDPLTALGDTVMGAGDGIRRAFWILDAASLGREAVRNATGHSVPPLDIAWPNDTRSRERTSYDPENMSMTLSSAVRRGTAHGAEAYPASILHEYGHHVLRTAYPDAAPAGSGGAACAAPIGRTASPSCAWSEDWAHFFPALVLGDPTIQYHGQRHPADLGAARWNVRSPSLSSAFAPGSAGQVASALWDLHDPAGEPGDTVANKTSAVWEALRLTKAADGQGSAAGPSFAEFAAAWNGTRSNPPLAGVMVLNGLASMRSLLAGAAVAPAFSDSFESGAGSWVVSGTGNWVAVPGAGHNGSAALYSSGCDPPRGCEATALASVNASEYLRAAFRILLEGGSQSVLTLQRSADGLLWSDAASYNGSVPGWREVAVDAMPAGAGPASHFRLVAVSPSPPNRSAVVDDVLIRADAPPTVSVPASDVHAGRHNRTLALAVSYADPDGDAVSLSLAAAGRAGNASVSLSDLGNGSAALAVRAGPADAGSLAATVTASAHGLSGSAQVRILVDDVEPPSISGDTGDRTAEATRPGGTPVPLGAVRASDNHDPSPSLAHNRSSDGAYPLGTTTILYTATDSSGNAASATQRITVADTTPPAIEGIPSDITAHRQRWLSPLAAVEYPVPTAKDLGEDIPVRCAPPPGHGFPLGTTAVACDADDGRGNAASARFTVTVAEAPILRDPSSPAPVSPPSPFPGASVDVANPRGVDTAVIGGSTYAVMAYSYPVWWYPDGVRITNITDPYRPAHVSDAVDGRGGFDRLGGAMDVAVATIRGGTYAAAVSPSDGAIQLVNITDPASPAPSSSLAIRASGSRDVPGAGAGIAAFAAGGSTYVIAAAPHWRGGGIHIANITDPASPALVATAMDAAGGFDELAGAASVAVAEIGGSTYAVVASSADSGVQVINITNPASPSAVSSATDGAGGFDRLDGAASVAVAEIGGSTYAVVASSADSGVQVINITNPASPSAVSSATDGAGGFDRLDGAASVAVAGLGASTYAVVASPGFPADGTWYVGGYLGGGVQVINITNPASPVPVSSMAEGAGGFHELYTASGVAAAAVGRSLYALVTSFYDNGLQIVGIEAAAPNLPPEFPPIPDAAVDETGRLRHDILASDPNGDSLEIVVSSDPPAPGLNVLGGSRLEWTPNASQSGSYNVTVTATDDHGASASDSFTLTVRDADARILERSEFASSLDGWSYKQVARDTFERHCWRGNPDTIAYSLSRSAERGGSAHLNYGSGCWVGIVGAAKSVAVPATHGGGDLRVSLDYRSRGTIYKTGDGSNNAYVMVSDSRGHVPLFELLYSNERVPGAGDTGWRSATAYATAINASACPCEVFVFLNDGWQMQHRQNFFIDNVNVSVAKPVAGAPGAAGAASGAAAGASGSQGPASGAPAPAAPSSLTADEVLAMLGSNGTGVLVTEKAVDGTSVSLAWIPHGGVGAYEVVAAAAGGGAPVAHAVHGTEYRIDGLAPHTEYEIRVGVLGDPATQSVVRATTAGG